MADKLITIARANYIHRAYFYKELLGSAGIECVIFNQGTDLYPAENEIEVQVEEEDVPKALEIVEEAAYGYEAKTAQKNLKISSVRNILVPVDFSPYSFITAKYALHLAKQKNASILFIHPFYDVVVNPVNYESFYSYPSDLSDTQHEIQESADKKMKLFMKGINEYLDLEELSGIKPRGRIMAGNAEEVVLSLLETGKFDLLILGQPGSLPSDSGFGTLTSLLIEKSSVPILVIPEEIKCTKCRYNRLMYATDFDKSDGIAIRKFLNFADQPETQLHVVHIDVTEDNPFINFNLKHFKEKYIGKIDKVNMVLDLIINENVNEGIKDYIAEKNIEILAVTTHKRNLFTSFLKPSVTKELLSTVPIPLLVFQSSL